MSGSFSVVTDSGQPLTNTTVEREPDWILDGLERRLLSTLRESSRVTEIRAGVSAFDALRKLGHWVGDVAYYGSIRMRSMSSFPANAIRVHGDAILSVDLYDRAPAAPPAKSKVGMMEHSCICKREGGRHTATCDEVKGRVEGEKCICASVGHDRGGGPHAAECNAKRMAIVRGLTVFRDGPGAWPSPVRLAPETVPGVGAIPRSEPATRVIGRYAPDERYLFNGREESPEETDARLAAKVEPKVGRCKRCGFDSCMHPRAS